MPKHDDNRSMQSLLYKLYLLIAVLMVSYGAIFTLLAEIRNQFGFSETSIGLIGGMAFISGFIAQLSVGKRIDQGQGRLVLRLGLALALAGSVWMIFADTLLEWLLSRGLLGFGAGCIRPAVRRLVLIIDPGEVGKNMGLLSSYEMAGFLLGPVAASVVATWSSMYVTFIILSLMLLAMIPIVVRADIPGSEDAELDGIHLELLASPAMRSCLSCGIAFYITVGVFEAIWAVFLADLGASQLFIGLTMSLFAVPMLVVAPRAGTLAQRRGPLNVTIFSIGTAALCMLTYGFLESIILLCIPLAIHSAADAFTMPANQLAVGMASGKRALATGQGLFGAVGMAVSAVAAIGGGMLYEQFGASGLWLFSALLMFVCLIYAWFTGSELRQAVAFDESN
ncbi:MAG: MFS transporter [Pseudomonadales bacterium]|nr:MFS transporter [Pseudomonadales bacterium]MDP6829230.1 MFS transporter [Pseudomonadales bacterium]MDP6972627.1 MFS transporter [Pseudomonadales bacterium]